MVITKEQLQSITKSKNELLLTDLVIAINSCIIKYQINTKQRLCHFLAQVMHESGNFAAVAENLNYSADGLTKIFKKYFPTLDLANKYARQPEKIANRVYANRNGNGDELSGDGWKYRGGGYLQLTGKANYKIVGDKIGVDLVTSPDLIHQPKYALESACVFWLNHNLNSIADKSGDDVTAITKVINGGINGLQGRQVNYNLCKTIIV